MDKRIEVGLTGHPDRYALDEAAYDRLSRYLDRAGARLRDDPDRAEVVGDLERAIGDKLAALLGGERRPITLDDIDAVLDEVGVVETGREPAGDPGQDDGPPRQRVRRLRRVREGQEFAGVCTGLAAYSEIRLDWVRTIVILGTLVTGGILGVIYLVLAFALPIVDHADSPA